MLKENKTNISILSHDPSLWINHIFINNFFFFFWKTTFLSQPQLDRLDVLPYRPKKSLVSSWSFLPNPEFESVDGLINNSLGCWIIGFSSVQFAHRIMGIGEFLHIAYPGGDYISLKNTMKEGGKKRKLQLLYQWLLIASFLFFYILLYIVINSS